MSVAFLIPENWDVPLLTRWAVHFTRAQRSDLLVLFVRRRPDANAVEELSPDFDAEKETGLCQLVENLPDDFSWQPHDYLSSTDIVAPPQEETDTDNRKNANSGESPKMVGDADTPDQVAAKHHVYVKRINGGEPGASILKQLDGVTLLIIPRHMSVRIGGDEFEMERVLFRDAPCQTMQLRPGKDSGEKLGRILVPAGSPDHSNLALEIASDLVAATDGEVTALFVEQEIDEVAEQVGQRILDRIVIRSLGRSPERLRKRVILQNSVIDGIRAEAATGYDLLMSSANYHGRVHRLLFHGTSEQLLTSIEDTPVAVVRRAMPLMSRLGRWIHNGAQSLVPQLDREHRIALVERIQTNSRWDFDFVALTCLSTLIAAMGLLQNSAAVVIGAMLVAPLMTPLLGAGLSLVQGNKVLLKCALGSVLRGFLLAMAIGWMLGVTMRFLSPLTAASDEMLARGQPGLLDLFVALISGVAAAYAVGRPNLLSALPGVAIAAALVPPIATSGLALAFADQQLAVGAALLFLTNIVAIILGTAVSLWLVGVRSTHEHGSFHKWSTWIAGLLILIALGLATFESKARIQTGLVRSLRMHLEENSDYRLIDAYMVRKTSPPSLHVKVEGETPADAALARELLEKAKENGLGKLRVELETQITTVVSENGK